MVSTTDDSRRLITSIERAADVLTLFTKVDSPDLGVTEIASELGLSKAVVHRVLTTLTAKRYIEANETTRRYRLGPMTLALGVAYSSSLDLRELVIPSLRDLSTRTNETATLSLRYGWERVYVDQVTPNREVKMTVVLGRAFPLHAGSSSKAFLAFLPEEEQNRYIEEVELTRLTDRTITSVQALREDLELIRSRGYATSFGERQSSASSIAAPLLNHDGRPEAVISVCGPLERFREKIDLSAELLLETTGTISSQLGYRTPS